MQRNISSHTSPFLCRPQCFLSWPVHVFKLSLPDGGVGGAGVGGGDSGEVAKLVEGGKAGVVVDPQIGWAVGADARNGAQGLGAGARITMSS